MLCEWYATSQRAVLAMGAGAKGPLAVSEGDIDETCRLFEAHGVIDGLAKTYTEVYDVATLAELHALRGTRTEKLVRRFNALFLTGLFDASLGVRLLMPSAIAESPGVQTASTTEVKALMARLFPQNVQPGEVTDKVACSIANALTGGEVAQVRAFVEGPVGTRLLAGFAHPAKQNFDAGIKGNMQLRAAVTKVLQGRVD